jgi:hypothetical protein
VTQHTVARWTAALLIAGGLAVSGATPASAAPVTGTLLIFPGASIDTAPMKVFTSGGCPDAATGYYTKIRGHGFPAAGLVVSTPTDAGMSHVGSFYAYFRETMRDYAKDVGTTLHGRYDVTVYCVDDLDTHYAEYTGAMEFSTPGAYVALGTARPTGTALPTPASPVAPDRIVPAVPSSAPAIVKAAKPGGSGAGFLYAGLGLAVLLILVAVFKYGQRSALRAATAVAQPARTARSKR